MVSPSYLQRCGRKAARFGKLDTNSPEWSTNETATGTGGVDMKLEQPSHKSAEVLVAVPRIERGTRGL